MKTTATVTKRTKISPYCEKCKGTFWKENAQERQKKVFNEFGIIPNHCANDEDGTTYCPFH